MALVCHPSQRTRQLSNRSIPLGVKRPYCETEDSDTPEEEAENLLFSRHCQAMWSETLGSYPKFLKLQRNIDRCLNAFLRLFDDPKINEFLWIDSCYRVADRYLLAMVFVYFKRAKLSIDRYNAFNFYTALYLANDMEEDEEDEKYEIFSWALGERWMKEYPVLLCNRDRLWKKMDFRAIVSRRTCEEVIAMAPDHFVWTRQRLNHHGGALRNYMKVGTPHYGRTSPPPCQPCLIADEEALNSVCRTVPVRELDFLDEIDLEYRQLYCHKPIPEPSYDDSYCSLNSDSLSTTPPTT